MRMPRQFKSGQLINVLAYWGELFYIKLQFYNLEMQSIHTCFGEWKRMSRWFCNCRKRLNRFWTFYKIVANNFKIQILFCEITPEQRNAYVEFIESKACKDIIASSQMPFAALMHLRKLCNHPDLVTGGPNKYGDLDISKQPEFEYGAYHRSGKMFTAF